MSRTSVLDYGEAIVTFACFEAGGGEFALPVGCVREIVRMAEIAPLPNGPALIEGVVDMRGGLIPIVDLARLLNRGRGRRDESARIVVVEFGDLAMGLWVDAALDILTLEQDRLEAVPGLVAQAEYDAVSALIRRNGMPPIMVLSLEHLIESIYLSAAPAAVSGGVA